MRLPSKVSLLRWVAIIGVLTLIAAACGSDTDDSADTTAAPATTAAPTETTAAPATTAAGDTTETTAAAPTTASGSFRLGVISDFTTDNFWAYYDTEGDVYNQYLLSSQAASLYTLQGPTYSIIPVLGSEAAPPLGAADGDNWVIEVPLQQGLTWSDGEAITADDAVFTFNTRRDLNFGGNWPSNLPVGTDDDPATADVDEASLGIIDVVASDDYTLVYTFNGQPGLSQWQFGAAQAPIMAEHYWAPIVAASGDAETLYAASGEGAPTAGGFAYDNREAGAFALNRAVDGYWDTGANYEVFADGTVTVSNDGIGRDISTGANSGDVLSSYVEGPNVAEQLFSVYQDQDAAVAALQTGDIDYWITPLGLQRGLLSKVLEIDGVGVLSNPSLGFRYLAYNTRRFPGNYTGFRQGLACMIDKEFMAVNVLQGAAIPMNSAIPAGNAFWANPDVTAWCEGMSSEERVNEAVRIMKEEGWTWTVEPTYDETTNEIIPTGEGLTGPAGETFSSDGLTLLAPGPGYDPLRATFSLFIQNWANDLGIPVRAEPTGFSVIVDKVFPPAPGDFDMYILGWGVTIYPDYMIDFFASEADSVTTGGLNTPGFANEAYDALAQELKAETDLDAARDIVLQMDAIIAEEVPYVVLFTTQILEAYDASNVTFPFTDVLGGVQNYLGTPASVNVSQ